MTAKALKHTPLRFERDGFVLRPARAEDAGDYYEQNFAPLDPEVARLTGSPERFERDDVIGFFLRCIEADDRPDLLLISPEGRIVGESVINKIDWQLRSANFRIAIFQAPTRGRGLGAWAVGVTRDLAFELLGLHRLALDVYSFNPRAEHVYLSAGFRREGVLRDAVPCGDGYADDILMALLEDEWQALNSTHGQGT